MIRMETAARIWNCYREIEVGKNLLADIEGAIEKNREAREDLPLGRDPFGRRRDYYFGAPDGDTAHRLLNVNPQIALSVVRAHIAEKESELVAANESARLELKEF